MPRSRSRITRQVAERECFLFHREVDLRVNMGGVQGDVPEPSPDSIDVYAGFLRINSGTLNSVRQMRPSPSLLGAISEEGTQGFYCVANSDPSPSLSAPKSKVGVDIPNMKAGEWPTQEAKPSKEPSDRAPELTNAVVGETTLLPGPIAILIQS
jgi:hypothetical protein